MERYGAQWAAATSRPNFLLPVFVESCEPPTLLAPLKRCDLHDLSEVDAQARLASYLEPASRPAVQVRFPGSQQDPASDPFCAKVAFPGKTDFPWSAGTGAISNIPINLPWHFLGREDDLAAIDNALRTSNGRAAIAALHGLRGVGKTTLAAAYAERHRKDYRATWWIRAETESTMRADLVGLGVQLGWIAAEAREKQAPEGVLKQLRRDGDGVLLVYDNAINADELSKFLPRGSGPHIIITSNAPNWGRIATTVQIEVWPNEVGTDFLIARTGRDAERDVASALSDALGGLPLAHEQAAAYCDRVGVTLADYKKRFEVTPGTFLDDDPDATPEYYDGRTVAKTFALAVSEAAKRHPAAERLITYAALLAPEPIPLCLFSEAREEFGDPFASSIKDNGLDEAVGALRGLALISREQIPDERDPSIVTDSIRLHLLVRQIAAASRTADERREILRELIDAMASAFPAEVHRNPGTWPRARRLYPIAMALVGTGDLPAGSESAAARLLRDIAVYRTRAVAAYGEARKLSERALEIRESALGSDHPETASYLNNLGYLLQTQGDLAGARPHYERALAIREKAFGLETLETASSLNNLGSLLQEQGDFAGAERCYKRALEIREKMVPDHPDTAVSLGNLGGLLQSQGDPIEARRYFERALAIIQKSLGPHHPDTAISLNNLGHLLLKQGELAAARPYFERALAIDQKVFGADHPETATDLNNLGSLLQQQGDPPGAFRYYEQALGIYEKGLGVAYPNTRFVAQNTADLLNELGRHAEAEALRRKFSLES